MISNLMLFVMAIASLGTPLTLLYDWSRRLRNIPTITQIVEEKLEAWRKGEGKFPRYSIGLVLATALAGIVSSLCLAVHFYGPQ